ncbi:MAG: 1-(5-phosphoribosyl)-5-[(5-phosphoribosylamino)methylideneamino]imidazole-4-carboxamide isomerase [Armatimonadota bacterium]
MRPLEIIPAIDLREGRAVRLVRGDYAQETHYHDDPVAVAQYWAIRGAPRLHVVDLEGALVGSPQQIVLIQQLCRAMAIPVQVGGGVRSETHVQQLLEAGADRVVLGTRAVEDPEFAQAMFHWYGERVVLALDVYGGAVAVSGWQSLSNQEYLDFARRMVSMGAKRIIFTNIALDGTLQGLDLEPLRALLQVVSVPIVASGGVRDQRDIEALHEPAMHTSLEGVIVGKALYEGTLSDTLPIPFGNGYRAKNWTRIGYKRWTVQQSTTPRRKPGVCPRPASRAGLRGLLTTVHRPERRYSGCGYSWQR